MINALATCWFVTAKESQIHTLPAHFAVMPHAFDQSVLLSSYKRITTNFQIIIFKYPSSSVSRLTYATLKGLTKAELKQFSLDDDKSFSGFNKA